MTYLDGSIYIGQFIDGVRNGEGKYVTSNNKIHDCFWKDGKPVLDQFN